MALSTVFEPAAWTVVPAHRVAETAGHLLALVAFAAVCYGPGLDAPFVFDDIQNIVANPAVQPGSLTDLPSVLESPVSAERPLAMASFALNYLTGALDPSGFRLVNVAVHVLNAFALYLLVGLLMRGALPAPVNAWRIAFWCALIWMVHPVQTQAVTYIVQRMTSLAALFYLLALIVWVLHRRGRIGVAGTWTALAACAALGMAAKPIVVTLPVALLLLDRIVLRPAQRPARATVLAILVATATGAVALAWWQLEGRIPAFDEPLPGRVFSPIDRLLTEPRVLWHYLSVFVAPAADRIHIDYDIDASRSLLDPPATLLAILATGVALAAAFHYRRRAPVACFSVALFFLASSVEASFLNLELAFLHRLYLPSVLLVPGLVSLLPGRVLLRATPLMAVVAAVLAHGTLTRNAEWSSGAELWARDAERGASVGRARFSRAIELAAVGRSDEAIHTLERELPRREVEATRLPLFELARAHVHAASYERALELLDLLEARFGASPASRFHRGLAALGRDRPETALAAAAAIESEDPGHPYARVLEARVALAAGEPERAEGRLREALEASAGATSAAQNLLRLHLAEVQLALGRYRSAYALYLDVIRTDPENIPAWVRIYRMQMAAGDTENAKRIERFLAARGAPLEPPRPAGDDPAR